MKNQLTILVLLGAVVALICMIAHWAGLPIQIVRIVVGIQAVLAIIYAIVNNDSRSKMTACMWIFNAILWIFLIM